MFNTSIVRRGKGSPQKSVDGALVSPFYGRPA